MRCFDFWFECPTEAPDFGNRIPTHKIKKAESFC